MEFLCSEGNKFDNIYLYFLQQLCLKLVWSEKYGIHDNLGISKSVFVRLDISVHVPCICNQFAIFKMSFLSTKGLLIET